MAINKNSTFAEIREEIVRNKVLADQNLEITNKMVAQLKSYRDTINEDTVEKLKVHGIYMDNIINADYDKLATDREYLREIITEIRQVMDKFKEVVVEILND